MSLMFCDCETHSLYGEICMFQYVGEKGIPVIIEYPEPEWLIKFVQQNHTVWYNASYDLGTITHQSGDSLGIEFKVDDLFYAARTAYPELERYGLDILHDLLDLDFYDKTLDKKKMQMSFTYAAAKKLRKATPDQIRYGEADVLTLRELWKQKEIQKVVHKNKAYRLDIKSLRYSLEYQRTGLPVDREALHKEQEKLINQISENGLKLGDLNCQSPKQVCAALGTAKSDKETLVKLISEGNELAQVVYDQRRLLKARKMLETWDYDRIHTFFNPAGTITGRFSASGGDVGNGYVNMQQISRQYQYIFHDTDPDMITFEIDYGTAELRAGCSIMGDEAMYQELMSGKDLHIEAAKLTGIENPTREDRQKGKAVSFGLIFSMSAPSFKEYAFTNYGVNFSDRKARKIHGAYHKKYKHISAYHQHCWNNYKTLPFESAMGRRNICRLGTDASNYATQSSIAESTKWAVHYLVKENPSALKLIINIVHDAVYMNVPRKDFDLWSERLSKAMLKGWKKICKSDLFKYKNIPMPVEVEEIK